MLYLLIMVAFLGAIVGSGLVTSLELTSLPATIWLWRIRSAEQVSRRTTSSLWFVLPPLATFVALASLVRSKMVFWLTMAISVAGTLAFYARWFGPAPRTGIRL